MPSIPFFIIEAFSVGHSMAYTGNPAAVCVLEYDDDITDEEKQKIASTLNMTETAFVSQKWRRNNNLEEMEFENLNIKKNDQQNSSILHRTIRWFTPFNEAPLCGHATLASTVATVATATDKNSTGSITIIGIEKIEFDSKFRGPLSALVNRCDGSDWSITLNFPINVTQPIPLTSPWLPDLIGILVGPKFSDNNFIPQDVVYCQQEFVLVLRLQQIKGEEPLATIRKVSPNFGALVDVATGDLEVHCFIVTIQGDGEKGGGRPQFYSRFFESPQYGLNEDPVTGMGHTILVPYWANILGSTVDPRIGMLAHQASERGGDIFCQLDGDRVRLTGGARIVLRGELYPENNYI